MPGLLIVAHTPLASALQAVAAHVYPDRMRRVAALDVDPEWSTERVEQAMRDALVSVADPEVLILVDVFGATPCNVAARLSEGPDVKAVCGANVPMLWRTLCYLNEPLDALLARALAGGSQGVMSISGTKPQNQSKPGRLNDQDFTHHQQ
jgi:PTS system ascorbate-specific IIA component